MVRWRRVHHAGDLRAYDGGSSKARPDRRKRNIGEPVTSDWETGEAFFLIWLSCRRCPEGAEVGSRSGMRRNVRQSVLPFRHPERSRGIFLAAAVYGMHAVAQKTAQALISHSSFQRCAREDFSLSLEMTIWGESGIFV